MRKVIIGYLFNESNLKEEDKIFLELAKKKNIELIMINTDKYIKEDELEEKIKKCDIFFDNDSGKFSLEIAKTIEEFGKKVVDSSNKFYYADDKWMFFVKCDQHKIPTPKTILLSPNLNTAKREVKEFNCWPVVLKRIEGTWGEYVDRAENLDEVEKIIIRFWEKGSEKLPIIAQEFIDSPSYRVTVIGDEIVQTALKESKGWKKTGVYAHHFKKFKVDSELKKIVDKIIKVFGIKVCGIDLFKVDGKWLVCEINSQPGLDFFLNDRKRLISKVLDFLKKQKK